MRPSDCGGVTWEAAGFPWFGVWVSDPTTAPTEEELDIKCIGGYKTNLGVKGKKCQSGQQYLQLHCQ